MREGRPERVNWEMGVAHGEDSVPPAALDDGGAQQRPLPPEPQPDRWTVIPRRIAHPGTVGDIAAGILLGIAAGKVVNSFINDVLLPPVGQLLGGVNFTDLFLILDKSKGDFASLAKAREAGLPVIAYGQTIATVCEFLVAVAMVLTAVKLVSTLRRRQEPPAMSPTTIKTCSHCCSAIPLRATRCPYCTSSVK